MNNQSHASESLCRQLASSLSGMFFRCNFDAEFKMLYLSENCEAVTGYKPEELINNNNYAYQMLVHPLDRGSFREQYILNFEQHLPCNHEYRIVCKSGRIKWVKEIATGQYNSEGKLLSIEGYIEDITAAKDSHFMASEFFAYQKAINSGSIVSMTDKKGAIYFANELFCSISKYSREELLGKDHRIINSDYHPKSFFTELWQTIKAGKIWRGEIKNKAKDGSYYWVDTVISPLFNEQNEIENYLSIRNLITDKKESEAIIKENLALTNGILSSVTSALAVVARDGTIINTNQAWNEIKKISESGLFVKANMGSNYHEILRDIIKTGNKNAEIILNGLLAVSNGSERIFEFEYFIPTPERIHYFIITITGFHGVFNQVVIRIHDITERKESENKIRESELKLKEANKIAHLGNWELNLQTGVTTWSEEALQIFGLSPNEQFQSYETFLSFVHPEDVEYVLETNKKSQEFLSGAHFENRIVLRDGTIRHISTKSDFAFDSKGKPTRLFGICQDVTELKEKGVEISKLAELNRKIIDSSDELFYLLKNVNNTPFSNKAIYLSDKAIDFFGVEAEQFIINNKVLKDFIHKDDIDRVIDSRKLVFETKKPVTQQYRIKNNIKNEYIWVYDYIKPILDDTGYIVELYGSMRDITELKNKEFELKKNKENYENLLNYMNDAFMVDNIEGKVVFANHKFLDFFGLNKNDLDTLNLEDYVAPEYHNMLRERHTNRVAGKSVPDIFEYEGIRKNGQRIWLEVNVKPLYENGTCIGTQSVIRDVSERKEKEIELKRNKENYENLLNYMNDAFMADDIEGKVVFANNKFLDFFGLSKNDLETMNLEDYVAPEYRQLMRERHDNRVAGKTVPDIFEYEGVRKDGKRVWLEVNVKPMYEKGLCTGTQSVIRDISERKEKQIELEKTGKELSEKYNELMQFNYIVSHNLRAPIANILGMTEIINMLDIGMEDKLIAAQHINTAVLKMDEVVRDLNLILETRSALNKKKLQVSISQLLNRITGTLEKQLVESGCLLHLRLDSNVEEVYTIKGYLESILYNLISNAIKYKSPERTPEITIITMKENESIIISISDNGIGLDLNKHRGKIFGLYNRFHLEVEGKGLGLYMCKTQVETLGGSISVESELRKGTTFRVTLPLK